MLLLRFVGMGVRLSVTEKWPPHTTRITVVIGCGFEWNLGIAGFWGVLARSTPWLWLTPSAQ